MVRRIISIVPSLTEAVAETSPESLVGCTEWCTHPAWLASSRVPRLGGTKNPDVPGILGLRPDLVLANAEENRPGDLDDLAAAGIEVLLTDIRDVPSALRELRRMSERCGWGTPQWLAAAIRAWRSPARVTSRDLTAVVPIWRRPWMAVGRDTYAGDVLARLGVRNLFADSAERYPRFDPAQALAAGAGLVVLPDEPYRFTADDGPEVFGTTPCALVSGRALTWYGPAMVAAPEILLTRLRGAIGD